jgi:hypothetical protein
MMILIYALLTLVNVLLLGLIIKFKPQQIIKEHTIERIIEKNNNSIDLFKVENQIEATNCDHNHHKNSISLIEQNHNERKKADAEFRRNLRRSKEK